MTLLPGKCLFDEISSFDTIFENLVVKEIEKLSDDYVLINDFNLSFSRPIFYKKQNQKQLELK